MTKCGDDRQLPSSTWSLGSQSAEQDQVWPAAAPEIEGYEVTGVLGYGGMGTVWSAVQLSTGREVALKFLAKGAFASQKGRACFEREVKLTARLQHPNIAQIFDSGLHRGVYYYAMELIDGVELDKYVEEHNLTQRQILELMRTVCGAVQHAHERGVIHRDLKPSNVLVTADGQPHVLDFGLAKGFLEEDLGRPVSSDGDVTGTPAYMAPEQAAGRTDRVDRRTDVYALGVVLFRLLTGESPHDLSGEPYEALRRVVEEEAKRPRDVTKTIDRQLESILLKAMSRQPDARYSSAGELGRDLDNYLNGRLLTVRPPGAIYFVHRAIRKHAAPLAVSLVGLVLLALRFNGNLQAIELRAYDTFLGWLPHRSTPAAPITVIGINEDDIKALGHYPITDEELAKLLDEIMSKGARVVGLDIYRDLEVGPGRADLNAVLTKHPEIIAVMQMGANSPRINPPDALKDFPDRVGFADQVVDSDGVIRRCLLFASDDRATYYLLALRLALRYLEPLGVFPQADGKNPEHLRLGRVTIRPFESNDGAYVNADAGGYQFLLDYKGPTRFRTFSLGDVQRGRVDEEAVRDRIVLIGVMADSVKDYVNVPGKPNLYGVQMQGICVEQLLRIALHAQRPVAVLRDWQESGWIILAIVFGAIAGLSTRSMAVFLMAGVGGLVAIALVAYLAFYFGWWIPVVPPLAGWFAAWLLTGPYRSRKPRHV